MSNRTIQPTERQRAQLAQLQKNFGLSPDDIKRCLVFSESQERPYIPPDLLIGIARSTGQFKSIEPEFSTYVRGLEQIIYKATVVDQDDRSITRVGVATIGEKPGGIEMDEHKLAEGRALNSVLADAGFNPFKSNSFAAAMIIAATVPDSYRHPAPNLAKEKYEAELRQITDDAERRRKDLGRIKLLAKEKGLIVTTEMGRENDTPYRDWLSTNFQTRSAVTMNDEERAQVINALQNTYGFDRDYLLNIPVELHADALIA